MSRALTLAETASELRKSKRWLQDWLAKNPVDAFGRPFCSKLGRTHLFDVGDLGRLRQAIDALDRRATFIYFVEVQGNIKIGLAANWKRRINALQTASPFPVKRLLILSAYVGFERSLHDKFSAFRVRGEWFKDCPEIREFIASAAQSDLVVMGGAEQ
jgi:hypothetical protein